MEKETNNQKMTTCKSCGKEIAKSAKTCPHCGAKNKKPVYKRVWFWFLIVFVVFLLVPTGNEPDSEPVKETTNQVETQAPEKETQEVQEAPTEEVITYTKVNVDEMIDMLDNNPMKAEKTYNNQYLEITGKLASMDSDGKYIRLDPVNGEFCLTGVLCDLTKESQVDEVIEMNMDDIITVRGKITNVGEVMGFTMDIEGFVK